MVDPAFAGYTPPYFYGTSIARIEFDPSKVSNAQSDAYTLEEIFDQSTVTYINKCERHPEFAQFGNFEKNTSLNDPCINTPASSSYMHLSASVNLFGKAYPNLFKFSTGVTNPMGELSSKEQEQDNDPIWVISTKFECPVLNFSGNVGPEKGTAIGSLSETDKACFDSQGMWYGSGSLPKENPIILGIQESFSTELLKPTGQLNQVGSLIEKCGFKVENKPIGAMRTSKKISEAIVAIPYDKSNGKFYNLDPETYEKIYANIVAGEADILKDQFENVPFDIQTTSIGNMIRKMSEYVIPPFLDFRNPEVKNEKNIKPFAMYIVEFTETLDQEDLQNIWQNVMPKISKTAKKVKSTISHQTGVPWEFFHGGFGREMGFIIFKVKKRAKNNYFALTPSFDGANQEGEGGEFSSILDLSKEKQLPYSFNWPYDFFSLVETAKFDCNITYEPVSDSPNPATGLSFPITKTKEEQFKSKPPSGDDT